MCRRDKVSRGAVPTRKLTPIGIVQLAGFQGDSGELAPSIRSELSSVEIRALQRSATRAGVMAERPGGGNDLEQAKLPPEERGGRADAGGHRAVAAGSGEPAGTAGVGDPYPAGRLPGD